MAIKVTIIPNARDGEPKELIFPKSEIRIGRGLYNDIVLDSLDVATNHAILTVNESETRRTLTISDLGSASGTRLEGAPIPAKFAIQMSPTQRIEIGGFVLKVDFISKLKELSMSNQTNNQMFAGHSKDIKYKDLRDHLNEQKEVRKDDKDNISLRNAQVKISEDLSNNSELRKENMEEQSSISDSLNREKYRKSYAETLHLYPDRIPSVDTSNIDKQSIGVLDGNILSKRTNDDSVNISGDEKTKADVESVNKLAKQVVESCDTTIDEDSASDVTGVDVNSESSGDGVMIVDDFDIGIFPCYNVMGRIVVNGHPVDKVNVSNASATSFVTDEDGRFKLEDLTEGTSLSLTFEKRGYRFFPERFDTKVDSHKYIFISGIELVKFRGRITRNDAGIEGVIVNAGNLGSTKTAIDGSFVIADIPLGTLFSVSFEKDSFIFESSVWEGVASSESALVKIRAIQLTSLTGRLLKAGKPLRGVEIEGGELGRVVTGQDGRYTFYNVREDMKASLAPSEDSKSFTLRLVPK